jgi:hypothetical protein
MVTTSEVEWRRGSVRLEPGDVGNLGETQSLGRYPDASEPRGELARSRLPAQRNGAEGDHRCDDSQCHMPPGSPDPAGSVRHDRILAVRSPRAEPFAARAGQVKVLQLVLAQPAH